jgi:Cu2+-exporting ATPase/Cu+-exporting ATPase
LTDTDLTLVARPIDIQDIHKRIILNLEQDSVHPIAFAFRKAFGEGHQSLPVENLREIQGRGVFGYVYGRLYEIRNSQKTTNSISCSLFENNVLLYTFHFETEIVPDCLDVLESLKEKGLRLILLSGDTKTSVDHLTDRLGFEFDEIHSEADPAQKLLIVSKHPNSIFVGDGVNDSLAMLNARVSIAVSGGVESALRSSDVYLTEPNLNGVYHLLQVSEDAMSLIKQNVGISFCYNVIGASLALMGYVNPLVAALLMPASSGFIVLSTWMRGRK